jgi:hypothetical protein
LDKPLHQIFEEWANDESTFTLNSKFDLNDQGNAVTINKVYWTLCARTDDWRLMSGGSQGYLSVWNHRIHKYLYKLTPHYEYDGTLPGSTRQASAISVGRRGLVIDDGSLQTVYHYKGGSTRSIIRKDVPSDENYAPSKDNFQLAVNSRDMQPTPLKNGSRLLNIKLERSQYEDDSTALPSSNIGSIMSFGKREKLGIEARSITALAFNDSNIVAASMNGTIHIWEPNKE